MTDTTDLFERARALGSSFLSDALDILGVRDRTLAPVFRAISPGVVIIGRAFTMQAEPLSDPGTAPSRVQFHAIDEMGPGDVAVISGDNPGNGCLWGEFLAEVARMRGLAGVVIEGCVRDVAEMREARFGVFATGVSPCGPLGRVSIRQFGTPIVCGGVEIAPGDIIVADDDGIIAVPKARFAESVKVAEAKKTEELRVLDLIRHGATLAEIHGKLFVEKG